jgi:diguanylate cyclase (GGDEF)-like protein
MDQIHRDNLSFLRDATGILSAVVALVVLAVVLHIRRCVTEPLQKMSRCARSFDFATEEDRTRNIERLNTLGIHTGDEIEELYRASLFVMNDSLTHLRNLNKAISDVMERDEQIGRISITAYKDALTGIGNKAAFNRDVEALAAEIETGAARFGMVMVDLNDLKYVNDTFGHEAGDEYIKGCCAVVCELFKHSPVYRIGGDEFVVILKSEDYEQRAALLDKLAASFERSFARQDAEPWERYSASAGMAVWEPSDESAARVFKRADDAMYANKLAFKAKHGSYR